LANKRDPIEKMASIAQAMLKIIMIVSFDCLKMEGQDKHANANIVLSLKKN